MSTYEDASRSGTPTGSEGVKERAVEGVAEAEAGAKHVAGVAGDEAGHVAQEAKDAARGFFAETRTQLSDQASSQQRRAAGALRSAGDELTEMAQGSQSGGAAAGLVRGLGQQTQNVASWLDQREPADLVQEVRGFARRHTGAFVVAAIGIGLVAGRLTRALMADSNGGGSGGTSRGAGGRTPASLSNPRGQGATYPTDVTGATTGGLAGGAAGGMAGGGVAGGGVAGGAAGVGTPIGDSLGGTTGYGTGATDADLSSAGSSLSDPGTDEWSATGEERP
ncbi:hypothetical protein [Microbacterium yannicii]|uniref:hypothetical protein n=1 Tax=Microbacterium yannicii TaxID=671622 RepID=UPI0003016C12|nr:hypothetical protein [Microbacterium yannicii]